DNAADIQELHDFIADGEGYEGTDEYVPKGVDPYELKKDAPKVATVSGDRALVNIEKWNAERKTFSAQVPREEVLRLRLLSYPAWKVEVNGQAVKTSARRVTGELMFPVGAGMNQVQITFGRTRDRLIGACVAAVSWVLLFLGYWYWRRLPSGQTGLI
ncbi:MAG: hypothetical protein DMG81_20595, partial [Acidobacteria bacterium]